MNTDATKRDVEKARDLSERVIEGAFSEKKEAAAITEARALFGSALAHFDSVGDTRMIAELTDDLGRLALNGEFDHDTALPLLLKAADLFGTRGDHRDRLSTLLDVAEINSAHPLVDAAVAEAVSKGLPDDIKGEEDPLRLAILKRDAKDQKGALILLDALVDEALARGAKARASQMLREKARTLEDYMNDRAAAFSPMERALELAEEAGDKERTLSALLGLTDLYWSQGNKSKARELFERAEKIRGVPEYLRTLRSITATYFK